MFWKFDGILRGAAMRCSRKCLRHVGRLPTKALVANVSGLSSNVSEEGIMVNAQRPHTPRWRFEKFDFDRCQIHISCPICFALTRLPIDDVMRTTNCSHANCTFGGEVQFDSNAESQYQEWKQRIGSAGSGLVDKLTWNPGAVKL